MEHQVCPYCTWPIWSDDDVREDMWQEYHESCWVDMLRKRTLSYYTEGQDGLSTTISLLAKDCKKLRG